MPVGIIFGEIGLKASSDGVMDPTKRSLRDTLQEYRWITERKIDMLGHLLDEAVYWLERTLEQTTDFDLLESGQEFLTKLPLMREAVLKGYDERF